MLPGFLYLGISWIYLNIFGYMFGIFLVFFAKSKNLEFDTKIKKRIIVRYYFDSINRFRDTSNRNPSKKQKFKIALNI